MTRRRVALVTGTGTMGIGRAIALALARDRCDLALHALDQVGPTEALAEEIRATTGVECASFYADLSDPSAARTVVRAVADRFGRLDILVNNASTIVRKRFLDLTDDDLRRVIDVNLGGYFASAQEATRLMLAHGDGGRVIMISSVNQRLAVPEQAAYCASKGAVAQLARVMALELAVENITVNLIAPGTIETDLNRRLLSDPAFRKLREDPVPMRKLGQPEDIAAAAVYLASDAARYVTGATITIDGGLSLP